MSVLVRFGKHKAFLREGKWMAANPELEQTLNEETSRWFREAGGPPIRESDQEGRVAGELARRLGGRVVLRLRSRTQEAARAFVPLRQMEFDFSAGVARRGKLNHR